jgi:hypothetical protein
MRTSPSSGPTRTRCRMPRRGHLPACRPAGCPALASPRQPLLSSLHMHPPLHAGRAQVPHCAADPGALCVHCSLLCPVALPALPALPAPPAPPALPASSQSCVMGPKTTIVANDDAILSTLQSTFKCAAALCGCSPSHAMPLCSAAAACTAPWTPPWVPFSREAVVSLLPGSHGFKPGNLRFSELRRQNGTWCVAWASTHCHTLGKGTAAW